MLFTKLNKKATRRSNFAPPLTQADNITEEKYMETKQLKELLKAFNTEDFGDYSADLFINGNTYRKPTVYPNSSHPRILFTKNTVDRVRENIKSEESAAAYKRYIELSESDFDGRFEKLEGERRCNYNADKAACIEAKAFRYAMTGEEKFGYEALLCAKNAMLTIDVTHNVGDWCRYYGHLMYIVACVYDWCYGLMTEEDKEQFIRGCVNLLGMHFEMCCYVSPENKLPIEQGTVYGHGAEDQLLVDYLSFAIASYNEAPEIYEFVGGRVLNDYVEAQNFLFQGGSHWEGTMYGSVRTVATIVSNILINKMTDGKFTPFTPKVEDAIVTTTYYIRPDGHVYRIGDTNENNTAFQFVWMANNCFYAGNFYKNPYLKSVGYEYLKGFTSFSNMVAGLSVVQFLALNDPEIPHTYDGNIPLSRVTSYPNTNIFARSANNDKNAFGIYMTMPECYASSHAHMECGSYQIFYKGPLASDSGAYDSWGGPHHMGYNMQTISSNSLLIYNPAFKDYKNERRPNMVYSGGQSIENGSRLPYTLNSLMKHPALGQCTSLGAVSVEEGGKYCYSYMGGDMTKAYDKETVDEVTRYMLAVATDNEDCPLVFVTFDRITAKDESFKKTALVHVQQEPHLTDDGFAVITNTRRGSHGKMILQNVAFDTEHTVIGGEGKEFWVVDRNIPHKKTLFEGSLEEFGWGRIEISPTSPEKTNRILTVMYVTDLDNASAPIRAQNICTDTLAGTAIFGKAMLFPKNEKLITGEVSFSLDSAADCYIAGVAAGSWEIYNGVTLLDTVAVSNGENILTFRADAGNYTVKPMS